MRIGIYGGTFNPIHSSHVKLARLACEAMKLEKLYLIPNGTPPHKVLADGISGQTRLNMVRMAVKDMPKIIASDLEIKREGASYTVDSLLDICKMNPNAEIVLIVGSDMLQDLPHWHYARDIFALATIAAIPRVGYRERDKQIAEELEENYGARIEFPEIIVPQLSSTDVRNRLDEGKTIAGMVPFEVEKYIYENGLYFPDDIKEKLDLLKTNISVKRFYHTTAVMMKAARLAEKYDEDPIKVMTAAMLHDCAKCIDKPTLYKLSGVEEYNENVLHAFAGATVAKNVYGVQDQDVLRAIRLHCTGDANMDKLSMIVYLADMTEFNRDFPAVEQIRGACNSSLEYGMLTALRYTMQYLGKKNYVIHPATMRALQYFEKLKKGNQ